MGKLKRRIRPSDITINIGKDAPIPECPIPGERFCLLILINFLNQNLPFFGEYLRMASFLFFFFPWEICMIYVTNLLNFIFGSWKEIRHDNTVTWLAYWTDPINSKEFKYVFLAASSTLKGQSDKEKYEKARLLKVIVIEFINSTSYLSCILAMKFLH